MTTTEEKNLNRQIDILLKELANSNDLLQSTKKRKEYYLRIEEMYKKDTRHLYSGIFSTLTAIHKGEAPGDLLTLQQNLTYLYENYTPNINKDENGHPIDKSLPFFKLYDHVELEIARINYSDGGDIAISSQAAIQSIKSELQENEQLLEEQKNELSNFQQELKSFNAQSITILGIFSGLVIGFATASDVLVAAFANLPTVGILDMSIFLILTGFVLFNVIFLLMQCIGKLTGQSLFDVKKLKRCRKDTTNNLADSDQKKPSGISLIIFYNVVSLLLIVVLYIVRIRLYVIDYMPAPMFIR